MEFWTDLDCIAKRWNVLEHSFYVRWSAGELERDELALYSGQYAHAVRALATASRRAAELAPAELAAQLAEHAVEEQQHVGLWRQFCDAVGGDDSAPALSQTEACARAWSDPDRDLLGTLAALYAIESAQPAISATKALGLRDHYGVVAPEANAYFDEHVVRDVEHAHEARALIDARLDEADRAALLREVERVLAANWQLLDGVEAAHAAM